jgi:hypothetical protein
LIREENYLGEATLTRKKKRKCHLDNLEGGKCFERSDLDKHIAKKQKV